MYERQWKIKTNINKFKIIMIANIPKQNIHVDNITIEYSKKVNLLVLHLRIYLAV